MPPDTGIPCIHRFCFGFFVLLVTGVSRLGDRLWLLLESNSQLFCKRLVCPRCRRGRRGNEGDGEVVPSQANWRAIGSRRDFYSTNVSSCDIRTQETIQTWGLNKIVVDKTAFILKQNKHIQLKSTVNCRMSTARLAVRDIVLSL